MVDATTIENRRSALNSTGDRHWQSREPHKLDTAVVAPWLQTHALKNIS